MTFGKIPSGLVSLIEFKDFIIRFVSPLIVFKKVKKVRLVKKVSALMYGITIFKYWGTFVNNFI